MGLLIASFLSLGRAGCGCFTRPRLRTHRLLLTPFKGPPSLHRDVALSPQAPTLQLSPCSDDTVELYHANLVADEMERENETNKRELVKKEFDTFHPKMI